MINTKKQREEKSGSRAPASDFSLEAWGTGKRQSVLLEGVVGIKNFAKNEIELKGKKCDFFIKGAEMSIIIYENRAIEIKGRIYSFELVGGEDRK